MREAELQREAQTQSELELPSVADIQYMQNAGHGVVIPSGGGIAAISRVEHGRAVDVPRTSVRDALMTDGEPVPSVKAAGCNDHTPKQFRSMSVNLSWSDPRNELSRMKDHDIANRKDVDLDAKR